MSQDDKLKKAVVCFEKAKKPHTLEDVPFENDVDDDNVAKRPIYFEKAQKPPSLDDLEPDSIKIEEEPAE